MMSQKTPSESGVINLPRPTEIGGAPFWAVLSARRSTRDFSDKEMPLAVLSQLLWSTHGLTARVGRAELRTAPSAGACYPIEVYVVANNVSTLSRGLYRYVPGDHFLIPMREGDVGAEITAAALGHRMCRTGSVTFVWTAVIPRTTGRYGDRGYRYIYMDAGHVGQNMYLAATALRYGCCTIGAFDDDAMNASLGIDGEVETAVYAAAVGPLE
jgi:SagB-type dehydrogenase family enzyme